MLSGAGGGGGGGVPGGGTIAVWSIGVPEEGALAMTEEGVLTMKSTTLLLTLE